jgi:hypothetical protein
LPFFEFGEKGINFVLLGEKERGKEGEKKEKDFNEVFHKKIFYVKVRNFLIPIFIYCNSRFCYVF